MNVFVIMVDAEKDDVVIDGVVSVEAIKVDVARNRAFVMLLNVARPSTPTLLR